MSNNKWVEVGDAEFFQGGEDKARAIELIDSLDCKTFVIKPGVYQLTLESGKSTYCTQIVTTENQLKPIFIDAGVLQRYRGMGGEVTLKLLLER